MIGEYPITWLVTELISIVLMIMCIHHALNQKDYKQKLFELLCFVIGSAIFEHVGVFMGSHSYDPRRIMMIGLIPLNILMIESVILYASMVLFTYLNMPKWTILWVVGFLCSFQDMSIDPVYVNDVYENNGVLSGQWNWGVKYDNNYFGIPFYNFSGWIYMTGIYAALILWGRSLCEKYNKAIIALYPIVAGCILLIPLMIFAFLQKLIFNFIFAEKLSFEPVYWYSQRAELAELMVNFSLPIVLMIVYRKRMKPIDLKKDSIIFTVPIILHLYDIIVGFGAGITKSYIPVVTIAVLHAGYFIFLYIKAVKVQDIRDSSLLI